MIFKITVTQKKLNEVHFVLTKTILAQAYFCFLLLSPILAFGSGEPYIVKDLSTYIVADAISDTQIIVAGQYTHRRILEHSSFFDMSDINDVGQMTGRNVASNRAVRVQITPYGDEVTELGTIPDGGGSEGLGINAHGHVVGYALNKNGKERAFFFDGEMKNLIPELGDSSRANDINNNNIVVGVFYKDSDNSYHAFYWDKSLPKVITQLEGKNSIANAINKHGDIVGSFVTEGGVEHAFLYNIEFDEFVDLGALTLASDGDSVASDINDSGQVVGWSISSTGQQRGFLYSRESGMIDVNDLLPQNSGWSVERVTAINKYGELVGTGRYLTNSRAFLLSNFSRSFVTGNPRLVANDAAYADQFGYSVSISENNMVVGAPHPDNNAAGAVYIYQYSFGSWEYLQKIVTPSGASTDNYGSSVAISGKTMVVGAYGDGEKGVNAGAVYVFVFDGINWVFQQKLIADNLVPGDIFGYSVAIEKDVIVVGSPNKYSSRGSAYIFVKDVDGWRELEELTDVDYVGAEKYGWSVALDENAIVVGSPNYSDDTSPLNSGAVYVYKKNTSDWMLDKKLQGSSVNSYDSFGYSVDVSGDVIVVGAPNSLNRSSHSVYIYMNKKGEWLETDRISYGKSPSIGRSVAVEDGRIVLGAFTDSVQSVNSGTAYIFENNGYFWEESARIVPENPQNGEWFGHAVALSGNFVVAGSPSFDFSWLYDAGSAQVYSFENRMCAPNCTLSYEGDMALQAVASPDPVPASGEIHYDISLQITDGVDVASPVNIRSNVSEGASFLSAKSSELCSAQTSTIVYCSFSEVIPGDIYSLSLAFRAPTSVGQLKNDIKILNFDANLDNNLVQLITDVIPIDPYVKITRPKNTQIGENKIIIYDGDSIALLYNSNAFPRGYSEGDYHFKIYLDPDKNPDPVAERSSEDPFGMGTLSTGEHTVRIDLVDFAGKALDSDQVTFEVEVQYPAVIINTPIPGQVFERAVDSDSTYFNDIRPIVDFDVEAWTISQNDKHAQMRLFIMNDVEYQLLETRPLFTTDPIDLGDYDDGRYKVIIDLLNAEGTETKISSSAVEFTIETVNPSIIIHRPEQGKNYPVDLDGELTANVEISNWLGINNHQFSWLVNGDEKGRRSDFSDGRIDIAACELKDGWNSLAIQLIDATGEPVEKPEAVEFTVSRRMPTLNITSPSGQIAKAESYPLEVTSDMGKVACATLYWYVNDQRMGEYELGSTSIDYTDLDKNDANTVQVKLIEAVDGIENELTVSEKISFKIGSNTRKSKKRDGGILGMGMGGPMILLMLLIWGLRVYRSFRVLI